MKHYTDFLCIMAPWAIARLYAIYWQKALIQILRDNAGISLMHYAARYGYSEIVTMLLEHPGLFKTAVTNGKDSPFYLAMKYDQSTIVKHILSACPIDKGKALCYATKEGSFNVVQTLLAHNIDANTTDTQGRSPLVFAELKRYMHIMKLLLRNGADVNCSIKIDDGNFMPLCLAACHRFTNVVQLLLDMVLTLL